MSGPGVTGPGPTEPSAAVRALFDQLCLRWAREADVVVQQQGALAPTLVLLPRDRERDEVAIRLEGLRGDLAARGAALVAELRPQTAAHDPAGLVLMTELRLGAEAAPVPGVAGQGTDGVAVYVSLGHPMLRRALGYRIARGADGLSRLEQVDDPPVAGFSWLDGLLRRPATPAG